MVEAARPMARGRLGRLSRAGSGGEFYHLQYRKDARLFQKYVPRGEAAAYGKATAEFRRFMAAVDAYVDEMSARTMAKISKEARDARGKRKGRPR